jgi:uncharacterized membrane protein YeaQ/YmgE (transglycosylase-associated protein family)
MNIATMPLILLASASGTDITLESLIIFLVIAFIAGSIGERIAGYSHRGCLTSTAVGFVGALIGTWAVRQFGLPDIYILHVGHSSIPILWTIIGAAAFVAVLSLITRRRWI